jgi:ribonuclease VapC
VELVRFVIDTSVLVAIALNEPERTAFVDRILEVEEAVISAVSVLEAGIVLSHGSAASRRER